MKIHSLLCAAAAFALTGLTAAAAELKAGDPAPNFNAIKETLAKLK